MKNKNIIRITLSAVAGLSLSFAAWANGNHNTEHQHGEGHNDNAIGIPGLAANVKRTVTIDMSDAMRFTPENITVKQGETIHFIVKNSGKIKHEFVLGTERELNEHYEIMKKFPEMEHADANMTTVAPGQTGGVVWQFTEAGKIDFACLQPGHYDAGMKGFVAVEKEKTQIKETQTPKDVGHDHHKH